MRRFHLDHEALIPDDAVLALWNCDDTTSSGLNDSAYTSTYDLVAAGNVSATVGFFAEPNSGRGSRITGSGATAGWFQTGSPASAHVFLRNDFSLSMWFQAPASATVALLEYANRENPGTTAVLSPFGLYRLANGNIRYTVDLSVASRGHFVDFNTNIGAEPTHLGFDFVKHSGSNTVNDMLLTLNGRYHSSATVRVVTNNNGASSQWVLGASKRYGTGTGGSPAFATQPVRFDDVAFYSQVMYPAKHADSYRNANRPWSERRMFDTGTYKTQYRVIVEDGDGNDIDLSNLYGVDFVRTADVSFAVDDDSATAEVILQRHRGRTLNLSPLSEVSVTNINAAGDFDSMLDLRRRVRIEVASVPIEWKIQSWEFEVLFDGFVNTLAWGAESVRVSCIDKEAILKDLFQIDPKSYDYYTGPVLAEDHIQQIIADNHPGFYNAVTAQNAVFPYLGGATPILYTPASSAWAINWADVPSGNVNELIRAVSDQIGWDLRWKWYQSWQQFRLTYSEPPRTRSLDIQTIGENSSGFTEIIFRIPHGLIEEQTITIAGTTNYNGATVVDKVLTANRVLTRQTPAGVPADEHVGAIVWSPFYTLADAQVRTYDDVSKNADEIRNACIVKFNRTNTPVTIHVDSVVGGSGGAVQFILTSINADNGLVARFDPGMTFEASGFSAVTLNARWTVGIAGGGEIDTAQLYTDTFVDSTGIISSEYLNFKEAVAVSTPSISKYGYRPAAIYEGSTGQIDSATESFRLAQSVVSDLADPTADTQATLNGCAPWFELHDTLTLAPDAKQRWTSNFSTAVTGVRHHLEREASNTQLALRYSVPTRGTDWVQSIRVSNVRQGIPSRNPMDTAADLNEPHYFGPNAQEVRGRIRGRQYQGGGAPGGFGKQRQRMDSTEMHISTEGSDFPVGPDTVAGETRGDTFQITSTADGTALSPGTTYWIKYRHKDIFGNLTVPSTATTIVPRYTNTAPGCFVMRFTTGAGAASSVQFANQKWCAYPFDITVSSPAYDRFANYTSVGNSLTGVLAGLTNPPQATAAFWRMPCDGMLDIDSRIGVRNSGEGKGSVQMRFGFMRIGSSMPGGNASQPVVRFYEGTPDTYVGAPEDSLSTPYFTTIAGGIGGVASPTFVRLQGTVSAYSGDYVTIGVYAEDNGIYTCAAADSGSVSASWARFTLRQN